MGGFLSCVGMLEPLAECMCRVAFLPQRWLFQRRPQCAEPSPALGVWTVREDSRGKPMTPYDTFIDL